LTLVAPFCVTVMALAPMPIVVFLKVCVLLAPLPPLIVTMPTPGPAVARPALPSVSDERLETMLLVGAPDAE
jgi:hypothetical protein